ncbi:MBL fold metallo-hydrolase [Aquimarina muelleri]|uniref:Metallo-beta-lactamase domain-containing protein n=1 Tax=Aquimarina muelleri TaxID=279356 RepID=A0A918N2X2_9FLAO|nr:MBL fold metallo-hydrolase [Aquimarina muelleri]MCX2763947.1 MBL fold metallo-hydrolase [Aquimarina muelleri]GGX22354.1 hypothetical protein GCM10007384_24450 [Aquimarina muelleri]
MWINIGSIKYTKKFLLITFIALSFSCSDAKTKGKSSTVKQTENRATILSDFIQQKITNNLYILKSINYNTNVGVFIGAKEVLLIDPMTGINNHQQLLKAIKNLSEKPIKYIINTHSHGDHSGANSFFIELGATLISHENVKYSKAKYNITFKNSYALDMGNEKIELYHNIAHTFDDVLIYFKKNNAIFMGDTYMTNSFPHFYYGGGSKGHLRIIDKALSLGNVNTAIIPAHGELLSNKKKLNTYRDNTVKWMVRIKELHDVGKTIKEIANDEQIEELSLIFNDGNRVSNQTLLQTINKTVSVDLFNSIDISLNILKGYEGFYEYKNGQIDEIIFQNSKLLLRSEGLYIYEIAPISKTKFHIKGQINKHVIFDNTNQKFIFFNGKENLEAIRKQ